MPPSAPSSATPHKKKRTLPGAPNKYPDAEVIALSPKTLMATNRFICEVCNKGFQREQNLQLHRRGHNLPWKLRQRAKDGSGQPVKKKVYLCPEPTCVHHDPARALGDLTGIKKHYFRKHGEKKYKCEKCSKRYAVQSDWKAHSKTCGTREYRCDCGTLFSRRDSFITHRAFCDALAQESARHPAATSLATLGSHLFGAANTNNIGLGVGVGMGLSQMPNQLQSLSDHHNQTATDILRLGGGTSQFDHPLLGVGPSSFRPQQQQQPPSGNYFLSGNHQNQTGDGGGGFATNDQQENHGQGAGSLGIFSNKLFSSGQLNQLPDLQGNSNPFNLGFFSNEDSTTTTATTTTASSLFGGPQLSMPSGNLSSLYATSGALQQAAAPHMSATALLQKAAQMGSTTSSSSKFDTKQPPPPPPPSSTAGFGGLFTDQNNLHALMNTLTGDSGGGNNGPWASPLGSTSTHDNNAPQLSGTGFNPTKKPNQTRLGSSSDGMTRDFLGVGEIVRSISGGLTSQIEQQQQQEGINTSNMTSSNSQAFGGGNSFQ